MDAYDSMFLAEPNKEDETLAAQNGKLRELGRKLYNMRIAALHRQTLTEDNSQQENKIEETETL